jgi:tetratricopeptide (TPR) repeat protein
MFLLMAMLASGSAAAATVPEALTASYTAETAGSYEAALKALDGLQATGDVGYVVALRRGWLLYLAGRYADAAQAYGLAVTLKPDSVEARLGASLPLMALRRWSEAAAACEAALKLEPGSYLAEARLAWVLFSQGRFAEAAARYEGVVRRYPSDVDMRAGLAWSWLKLGKSAEARAAFQWVLQVAPAHASAKEGLAAAGG